MVQAIDVAPPVREVWRLGLTSTARQASTWFGPDTPEGQRLAVAYAPGFPAEGSGDRSFNPCESANITWPTRTADTFRFVPWGIAHYETCPTIGADPAQVVNTARGVLASRTSHLLEQVLWSGVLDEGTSIETMAAAENADNRRLASSAAELIDGTGGHDLTVALGLVNEWAADTVGPFRVWIHAEPRLTPFVAFYGQGVRVDNGLAVSQSLGEHRIVFGTGYTGSSSELSATVDESWLIVTGPVRVIEGPISPTDGASAAQFVDRARNRVNVAAVREVNADWDLTVHAAIKVCLPAPGPACE